MLSRELSWSAWSSWRLLSAIGPNELAAGGSSNPIQDDLQFSETDVFGVSSHSTSRSSPQLNRGSPTRPSRRSSICSSSTLYSTAPSHNLDEPCSSSDLSYLTDEGGVGWNSDGASRSSGYFTTHSGYRESLQNVVVGRSSTPFSVHEEGGTSDLAYLADVESAGNESDASSRLSNNLPPFLSRAGQPNMPPKSSAPSGSLTNHLRKNPSLIVVEPLNTEPLRHHLLTTGTFRNGHKLKRYQLADLRRLVRRESGERVCGSNIVNRVGYLLAYQMGLGKTAVAVALIACNQLPRNTKERRATLVIVPNQGVMDHWVKEIQTFSPHLDTCCYRSTKSELRHAADVVLVTYRQMLLQYANFPSSSFFRLVWLRVICDESHDLRNPSNKTVEAICALRKVHGLCLTGTPVQNSALDLYSVFKFLGVTYEGIDDLKKYKRLFCQKTQKDVKPGEQLLDVIKKDFCIFRSFGDTDNNLETESDSQIATFSLPERRDFTVDIILSPMEELIYDYIKDLPLSNLVKISRLRQACDHPCLVYRGVEEELDRDENDGKVSSAAFIRYAQAQEVEIRAKQLSRAVEKHFMESFRSAKLKEMSEILLACQGQKTIIFTHFTRFLPAIAKALYGMNIAWTEYTGDMEPKQKQESLKRIREDSRCSVIVISILSGNTGLDITCCNNIILMEPWWNPFTEEQAIARAYRLGQTLPVRVFRLVVKNSIEESILKTQQAKKQLTTGTMNENCEGGMGEATQQAWLAGP